MDTEVDMIYIPRTAHTRTLLSTNTKDNIAFYSFYPSQLTHRTLATKSGPPPPHLFTLPRGFCSVFQTVGRPHRDGGGNTKKTGRVTWGTAGLGWNRRARHTIPLSA